MFDARSSDIQGAARHLCRHYFAAFARRSFDFLEPGRPLVSGWHIDHLCHVLSEVEAGRIRRLIVNIQPRSLKSHLISASFPAWLLGRDPGRRIICVSYGEPLARFFGVQTRSIMQSPWYGRTFPGTRLSSSRPKENDLLTQAHGSRYAVGIGGAITGRGADFILCDDPMKAQDALSIAARQKVIDFVSTSLWSRLNDRARGAIVLAMQRLHENDLAGHLIRQGGWTVVSLPAIATEDATYRLGPHPNQVHVRRLGDLLQPTREGLAELDEQKRILGSYNFEAQYQQQPVPAAGLVVKRDWLRFYDEPPKAFDRQIISWDTASTLDDCSDFSVGTVWGRSGDRMYLLDVVHGRYEAPQLQRAIIELAERYEVQKILIENDGIGRGIVQNLRQRRLVLPLPTLVNPKGDKKVRFARHLPLIEDGRLWLPRQANWLGEYLRELLAFPSGAHDDQIDSTTQALDHLVWNESNSRPLERPNPERKVQPRRDINSRDIPRR